MTNLTMEREKIFRALVVINTLGLLSYHEKTRLYAEIFLTSDRILTEALEKAALHPFPGPTQVG